MTQRFNRTQLLGIIAALSLALVLVLVVSLAVAFSRLARDGGSDDVASTPPTNAAGVEAETVATLPPVTTEPRFDRMPQVQQPDALTTGPPPGVTFRQVSPDPYWVVTEDVDGIEFTGMIVIGAPNITISNSIITADTDAYGIWNIDLLPGVIVDQVEIRCEGDGIKPTSAGIKDVSLISRSEITGCADGLKITSDTAVVGNYIHDLANGPGIHSDGIQMQGGDNVTIERNTIVGLANAGANAAIFVQSEDAPISNVRIAGNYLSGFGFTVRLNGDRLTGSSVLQNVIGPGFRFAPILFSEGAESLDSNNLSRGNFLADGSRLD